MNNAYFNEPNEVKCDLKNINTIKNLLKVININLYIKDIKPTRNKLRIIYSNISSVLYFSCFLSYFDFQVIGAVKQPGVLAEAVIVKQVLVRQVV